MRTRALSRRFILGSVILLLAVIGAFAYPTVAQLGMTILKPGVQAGYVIFGAPDGNAYAMTGFADPVTVSFTYRDDQINYWRVQETTLRIMRSDDSGDTWLDIATTIDANNRPSCDRIMR